MNYFREELIVSKYIATLLLALATVSGFSHAAPVEQPGEGDKALFLSEAFTGSPTYNLGMFLSDKTMVYGTFRIESGKGYTDFGLGGGARLYQDRPGSLRTFFDGNIGLDVNESTGIKVTTFGIGGFFGAEYMASKNASIGAKVGATLASSSASGGGSSTVFELGAAEVMLNFYF